MENRQHQPAFETSSTSDIDPDHPAHASAEGFFEIQVRGHLHSDWADWFEGFEIRLLDNGEMVLYGPIADQSALMGVLNKIIRLNLTLLSINPVKQKGALETI